MRALVLAAGKGSRLAGVRGDVPKPLVEVGGTSPLEHALAWVAELEPDRIWINVHEAAELVRMRIGESVAGVPIHYSYESELLGTAGSWKKLEREWDDTSLVVYGDNFMRFDLGAQLAAHRAAGRPMTVALFDPDVHANTGPGGGRAVLDGDVITDFIEGGASGPINAGVYFIEPALRERLRAGFLDFGHDVLPQLAHDGELTGHLVERDGYCLGVDTPERLQLARELTRGEVAR